MRRKDKEISDFSIIENILKKANVCRVAMCDGDEPYIVPLNFAFQNQNQNRTIYIHSASSGRKIDVLRKNNKICVEIDADAKIIPGEKACNFSMKYQSIIGFGVATICEDEEEKKVALDLIMQKYSGNKKWEYISDQIQKLAIIKIKLNKVTGKKSHLP